MGLLSLGLIRYYSMHEKFVDNQYQSDDFVANSEYFSTDNQIDVQKGLSKTVFAIFYSALLVVCIFFSTPSIDVVYTNWNLLDPFNTIKLVTALLLCFILPGYAVIAILTKNYRMQPLLKILLGYLISILITGLTVYFSSILFDSNIYQDKFALLMVHLAILIVYVVHYRIYRFISTDRSLSSLYHYVISALGRKLRMSFKMNISQIITFSGLSLLMIISTYYVYGGVTVGDQWYHQNRAILFMDGNFKDSIIINGDQNYTPLLSALLAGLTSFSGLPLVNAYSSIALFNMTSVFAFYVLCRAWFPANKKKAALFASTLLVIASGFGWMYMIYLAVIDPIGSPANAISYFVQEKIRETDIRLSSNFIIAAFPDFNTSLTLVSLPAGFILLALIKIEYKNKIIHTALISLVSVLGILFHDEFYFFIILSSLLVFTYYIRKSANVYFAFLIVLASVYVIDSMLPVNYFTSNRILGIPVIALTALFITAMLSLYILRQNWIKYFSFISNKNLHLNTKLTRIKLKVGFKSKVVIVSIIVYLFTLCFLVWIQLPANYIDVHTQNYNTPWYVYPMRMGTVGVIGIGFLLSYLFKKFEREVFIFGMIAIIALLAGPYYNEHRFSKYVMVGMIGFASLMIFKILDFTRNKNPVINGVLIASIVITASLSTLMYIGYNALVIQTEDYSDALGRRNFPSATEMTVLDEMRSKVQDISSNNNIATFSNEYNFRKGDIISKLHAFSGLPLKKSIQTQYLLNSSSADSFYHLLDLSNTGYIMIPSNGTNQFTLTDPTRFAITNFPELAKNDKYLVLKVPSLQGPSTNSQNKVGIISDLHEPLSSMILHKKTLQVDNRTFNFEKDTHEFIQVGSKETEKATLFGYKKNGGKTLWSNELDNSGINYMELKLMTLNETKSGKGISGLKWKEGDRSYFVSLSNKGLQLREQITEDDKALLLAQNSQIKSNPGMEQILRVVRFNNSITVYVDNSLTIKIPKYLQKDALPVRSIGIYSENSVVEFEPVQIGKIEASQEDIYLKEYRYYYYPLTSLAMTGVDYSSYANNDYSIFSNSEVILPFDSQELSSELFNNLLNYTRSGGTLVVLNPSEKLEGKLAKLLDFGSTTNKTQEFVRIAGHEKDGFNLDVSGSTREFNFKSNSNVKVFASYRNSNNTEIAPFAIEKMYDKGRIIYVNSFGYFDAISAYPKKNFLSLGKFADVFQLDHLRDKVIENKTTSPPIKRFIGDVTVGGKMTLNGSSFSIDNSLFNSSKYYVKKISILDRYGILKNQYENFTIVDIKPFGQYEHLINFTDKISLPSTNSKINYMEVPIPDEFNMTVKLHGDDNSRFTIITNNSDLFNTIQIGNESKIQLYGILAKYPGLKNIPVLLKNPELLVNGNVLFDRTNFYGQEIDDYIPLNASGYIQIKFDLIDDFQSQSRQGTKIDYLSYIGSLGIDGKRNQIKQQIDLPGQISLDIEKRGLGVPISSILGSLVNFIIIIAITLASIIVVLLHENYLHDHNSS